MYIRLKGKSTFHGEYFFRPEKIGILALLIQFFQPPLLTLANTFELFIYNGIV